jgi:hypothetical protein
MCDGRLVQRGTDARVAVLSEYEHIRDVGR